MVIGIIKSFCIGFVEGFCGGLRKAHSERLLVAFVAGVVFACLDEFNKRAKKEVKQRANRFDPYDFNLN